MDLHRFSSHGASMQQPTKQLTSNAPALIDLLANQD
jgi:hypothetical protein